MAGLALLYGLVANAPPAHAQLYVPAKGQGTISATGQVVTDHYHLDWQGNDVDAGKIETHSLQLKFDYGLSDRFALSVAVPYLRKQYRGNRPHNDTLLDPPGKHEGHVHPEYDYEFLDDGRFHGHWQDPAIALRYRWREAPVALTPFVSYAWPSHDYTFYAHAAPGTRQTRLAVGSFFGRRFAPPWQNTYLQGYYSYTFVEEVLDINVDYSTLNLELGYFFSERWAGRVHATYRKTHGGLDHPIDFRPVTDTDREFNHDRIQRIDYLNLGLGGTYVLSENYTLSLDWMTTAWGENGHKIHNAVTLGLHRSF